MADDIVMTDSFNQAVNENVSATIQARTEEVKVEPTTQVADTTTTTQPDTTTTAAPNTTTETPTAVEWWKEVGAESAEVVKEKYTGYDTLKQEFESLKAAPPTVQPYKNELSKFIDNLPQGVDPKFAVQYFDVKPETLSDEQAWKLNEKFSKPYLSEEEINAKYENKFGFDADLATDSEKILKSGSLKEEGFQAKNALNEFIGKTLNPVAPNVAQADNEAKVQKLTQEWSAKMPTIANTVKEISKQVPVKMFGSDEPKLVDFNYQLDATEQKAITEEAYKIAVQFGLEPNESGLKTINEVASNLMWQRNGEKIAQAMVSKAVSDLTENFKSIINNPNLTAPNQTQTSQDRYSAAEKSVVERMSKGL